MEVFLDDTFILIVRYKPQKHTSGSVFGSAPRLPSIKWTSPGPEVIHKVLWTQIQSWHQGGGRRTRHTRPFRSCKVPVLETANKWEGCWGVDCSWRVVGKAGMSEGVRRAGGPFRAPFPPPPLGHRHRCRTARSLALLGPLSLRIASVPLRSVMGGARAGIYGDQKKLQEGGGVPPTPPTQNGGEGGVSDHPPLLLPNSGDGQFWTQKFSSAPRADDELKYRLWFTLA